MEELCQGEHGARLVVERLRVGSVGERRQVWRELGLPATLARHLASPTCRPVIHTLMQVDAMAMEQLMEEARQEEAEAQETRVPGDTVTKEARQEETTVVQGTRGPGDQGTRGPGDAGSDETEA